MHHLTSPTRRPQVDQVRQAMFGRAKKEQQKNQERSQKMLEKSKNFQNSFEFFYPLLMFLESFKVV